LNDFYVYAYLREDLSPYYIGKGSGKRINKSQGKPVGLPSKERRIKLLENLTEEQAFTFEMFFIEWFGRKDLGTGILYNKSNGGEGASGWKPTEEQRAKIVKAVTGRKHSPETRAKLRVINTGKRYGEETQSKKRIAMTGFKHSAETVSRMRRKSPNASSKFFGVSFDKIRNKWRAQVVVNRNMKAIGRYTTEEYAAKAYDEYAISNKLNLPLNFPKKTPAAA
jgi:AP2 domain/NUMOD3 motif